VEFRVGYSRSAVRSSLQEVVVGGRVTSTFAEETRASVMRVFLRQWAGATAIMEQLKDRRRAG